MSEHTQGPWKVEGGDKEIYGALPLGVIADDEHGMGICDLYEHNPDCKDNAGLIAAAPELLALAEKIVDEAIGVTGANTDEAATIEAWEDAARDAIAKAKGE